MVKIIKKITKNSPNRERRKIIVVGTEGENKTEESYLRALERKQNKYHFVFADGNYTDPVRIVEDTIKKAEKEDLDYEQGDIAISIFDLDLCISKKSQLSKAKALCIEGNVQLITSNPCFEIWFLEHFQYTSKGFDNSKALIKELNKHLPGYTKSMIHFDDLYPLTGNAIKNCERLDRYHKDNSRIGEIEFCNPRTDMYKLVSMIIDNNFRHEN